MYPHHHLWQQHFPGFLLQDDKVLGRLIDAAILFTLPAQRQVFYPGKACQHYLLLLSGSIRAQLISDAGEELLLYHVLAGDSCVLTTSCLLGGNQYPAEGMTETDVQGFLIPAPVFHRCLEHSIYFREFVFSHFSRRLSDVIQRMANINFGSTAQKLAKHLMIAGQGELHITHQELANELATAREVVSRHLKRFESYGWVRLHRGSIELLNIDAMQALTQSGFVKP